MIKLDTAIFQKLAKEYGETDQQREQIIKASRDILKLSKKIIYAVHRQDLQTAKQLIGDVKSQVSELKNGETGMYSAAIQEFVEAVCYYEIVANKRLPTPDEIGVSNEHYLLGIGDIPGELVRRAVAAGVQNKLDEVMELHEFVAALFDELMQFDFRNSELRRKVDAVRRELRKLDQMVFDMKIRQNGS